MLTGPTHQVQSGRWNRQPEIEDPIDVPVAQARVTAAPSRVIAMNTVIALRHHLFGSTFQVSPKHPPTLDDNAGRDPAWVTINRRG